MSLPPLALPEDEWRARWLHLGRGAALHRVASIEWRDEDRVSGKGSTVCGRTGDLAIPGVFSRMGGPLCVRCCKALGIPEGAGAPFNALTGDARDA